MKNRKRKVNGSLPEKMLNPVHDREMQIKATLRYHFSPIGLAKLQTSHNIFY